MLINMRPEATFQSITSSIKEIRTLITIYTLNNLISYTYARTTLPPPTTTNDGGAFFDDDNNKAMYLVLPAMVLVYGGCAAIWCVHRGRRYCVRKKREKMKEEKRRSKRSDRVTFSNPLVSPDHPDEPDNMSRTEPGTSSRRATCSSGDGALHLENMDDDEQALVFTKGKARCNSRVQETDVDELEDVLQAENKMGAVAPGYTDSDLSKEMMHLDNQLKAAFRLTQDTTKTAGSKGGAGPEAQANFKSPQAYPKTTHAPDTGSDVTSGTSTTTPPSENGNKTTQNLAQDDLESILKIRKKVKKRKRAPPLSPEHSSLGENKKKNEENARSKPDVKPLPDENIIEIKRVHIKGVRKLFQSSQ